MNPDASLCVFPAHGIVASCRHALIDPADFLDNAGRLTEESLGANDLRRSDYSGSDPDRNDCTPELAHDNARSKKDESTPSASQMADEPLHASGQSCPPRGIVTLRHFLEVGWWLVAVVTCKFLAAAGRFQSAVHLLPEGLVTVTSAQFPSPLKSKKAPFGTS